MKIGIIANPFGEKEPSGLGTSTFEVTKHLIEGHPDISFEVFVKGKKKHKPDFKGDNWTFTELPAVPFWLDRHLPRKGDHDLFIFVSTPVMPLTFTPKNAVVIARDFGFLHLPSNNLKHRLQNYGVHFVQRSSLKRAKKVVAISEQTKREAMQYFGLADEKMRVVYNGLAKLTDLHDEPVEGAKEPFLFYMGVVKERKNLERVLEAFAVFKKTDTQNFSFVLAGKKGGEYFEKLESIVEKHNLKDSVLFPGYITDEQGAHLYRHARGFIFPSLFEGFGKPAIEAMSFGTPVITSDEPPLNEITGDAACLVDPRDVEDIAAGMNKIATDSAYADTLREKGLAHSKLFTWEKTAEQLVDVFRNIVEKK